jgi:hypothetical protein
MEALRKRAEEAVDKEALLFEADVSGRNGQDARWLQQVRKSGTTADKLAALTLLVQVVRDWVCGRGGCADMVVRRPGMCAGLESASTRRV